VRSFLYLHLFYEFAANWVGRNGDVKTFIEVHQRNLGRGDRGSRQRALSVLLSARSARV
jgi:hypothetical protein